MGLFRIRQNVGLLDAEETRDNILNQWNKNIRGHKDMFEVVDVCTGWCLWYEDQVESVRRWADSIDTPEMKGGIVTALLRYDGDFKEARRWYYQLDQSDWAMEFEEVSELELIAEAKKEV